jgi:hypothetical protein
VSTVFVVAIPTAVGLGARLLTYVIPAVLVAVVLVFRRAPTRWLVALWVPLPLLGIAGIAALDLAAQDASAAGQVFRCCCRAARPTSPGTDRCTARSARVATGWAC